MSFKTSRRPSPAFVVSCLALFVALSGTAVGLAGKNTVDSGDIKNQNVKSADIKNDAVGSSKVAPDSLGIADIATDGVGDPELGIGAVTSDELGEITTVQNTGPVPGGTWGFAIATCPAGSQLISGGANVSAVQDMALAITLGNFTRNTWSVFARNYLGTPQTVTAEAYCLIP